MSWHTGRMIRLNNKIRLTDQEKDFLSFATQEAANPGTVQEHDAWVDHAIENVWNEDIPEFRLMRAILSDQKIER